MTLNENEFEELEETHSEDRVYEKYNTVYDNIPKVYEAGRALENTAISEAIIAVGVTPTGIWKDDVLAVYNKAKTDIVGETNATNLFNGYDIIEKNPNGCWLDIWVISEDHPCLAYNSGAATGNQYFMRGEFKENTRYTFAFTIRMNYINNLQICYTDGTRDTIKPVVVTDELRSFVQVVFTSQAGKTVDYWRGVWNNEGSVYIDMQRSVIVETSCIPDILMRLQNTFQ